MTNRNGLRSWLAGAAAILLAACNGGGGSTTGPGGGGTGAATVRGAVQSLDGALTVNGVAFRTTGAQLRLPDDSPTPIVLENEDAVRGHLDDGMVVTVRGSLDDGGVSGQATEIEFHDLMEGTIDDHGPGRIRVLGDDVSLDDGTRIVDAAGNPLVADDLSNGRRVEVSGHGDGRGGVRATFVRARDDVAPETEREVKGYVIAISGSIIDLSFTRGGPLALRADLAGVASPPSIAIGDLVEVKTMGPPDASGILVAVAIHLEDELEAQPQEEVEIEGIVTAVGAGSFTLAGQVVIPDVDATFVGGTPDDLVVGVEVEAEGFMGDDGVLHARKVKFEANARIDGNLEARDELAATLTILGITVHVTPSTELRSITTLADLAPGDRVEVRGTPNQAGTAIDATRVELLSTTSADRAFLRAVVSAATPTTALTMMGLAIDTSAASFRNTQNVEVTAAAFFDAIVPGQTIVKVRWRPYPASTAEPIDEAELEN